MVFETLAIIALALSMINSLLLFWLGYCLWKSFNASKKALDWYQFDFDKFGGDFVEKDT